MYRMIVGRYSRWVMITVVWGLVVAAAPLAVPADVVESDPVVPELAVAGVEVVGGEAVATMTVMARRPVADVQIQVELSDGLERTAGEPAWRGGMAAGEVRIVEISFKLLKPGRRQVVGRVTLPADQAPKPSPVVLTVDHWLEVKPAAPSRSPTKE